LRRVDCRYGQGDFFSRPLLLPIKDFTEVCARMPDLLRVTLADEPSTASIASAAFIASTLFCIDSTSP
jgi:hypothetical protein